MVTAIHQWQKQDTFKGIGAEIQMQDGHVVVAPLDCSPAEKAGLRPGDISRFGDPFSFIRAGGSGLMYV